MVKQILFTLSIGACICAYAGPATQEAPSTDTKSFGTGLSWTINNAAHQEKEPEVIYIQQPESTIEKSLETVYEDENDEQESIEQTITNEPIKTVYVDENGDEQKAETIVEKVNEPLDEASDMDDDDDDENESEVVYEEA